MRRIVVGTRRSRLAISQTEWVIESLRHHFKEVSFELKVIVTKGDQIESTPLDKIGDKGLFTQAIEAQLLSGEIDFAVHSLKDLPSRFSEGLSLSQVPKREDARDVLVLREGLCSFKSLPHGARIGTGSKRRLFQIMTVRPDIVPVPIRGNIETRIKKIESENLDGVILAAAGLHRIGISDRITEYLPVDMVIPAPAQGALGLQYRTGDESIREMLLAIRDEESEICVRAERAFLMNVEGNCHVPIGAYAEINCKDTDGTNHAGLKLTTVFGDAEGHILHRIETFGELSSTDVIFSDENLLCAEEVGKRAAESTLRKMSETVMVSLVGAGPGDEGLITVKGLERLKACDAVVYDRLVSPELLRHVPVTAEKIYVGKAASEHTLSQDEINDTLSGLAKTHKRIVRLKGGDPFVFGRGGEEALHLKNKGIQFEVIPGITSPISGLAYSGIPITHRDLAASFHVFTGHFKSNERTLDFETISKLEGTLVFLMSIGSFKEICSQLVSYGKAHNTPIAIVSNGTTGKQIVYEATLGEASQLNNITSPAFLAVGEVVKLRTELKWFEKRPLFGKTVMVTRAGNKEGTFALKLRELGAKVIEHPVLEIQEMDPEPLMKQIDLLDTFTHLWFTSEVSVKLFFAALETKAMDTRALAHHKILAIGSSTAACLKLHGVIADFIPEKFTQEGIVEKMMAQLKETDRILMPSAEDTRRVIKEALSTVCDLVQIPIYRSNPIKNFELTRHDLDTVDYVTFTSASAVKQFNKAMEGQPVDFMSWRIISIGPVTTSALNECGYYDVITSKTHTLEGMIETLLDEEKTNNG